MILSTAIKQWCTRAAYSTTTLNPILWNTVSKYSINPYLHSVDKRNFSNSPILRHNYDAVNIPRYNKATSNHIDSKDNNNSDSNIYNNVHEHEYSPDSPSNYPLPSNGTMSHIISDKAEYYIIGTVHVSESSAAQVADVIQTVNPTMLMIELCDTRYESVARTIQAIDNNLSKGISEQQTLEGLINYSVLNIFRVGPINWVVGAIMKFMYTQFIRLGFRPGAEFQTAVRLGLRRDIVIVVGDQPVQQTLHKLSRAMLMDIPLFLFRSKFLTRIPKHMYLTPPNANSATSEQVKLLKETVERLRNRTRVREITEMTKECAPNVYSVMTTERDKYLFNSILQCEKYVTEIEEEQVKLSRWPARARPVIVVVVGLAHCDGLEQHLKRHCNK
jgi:pheromone shutdown protein TraB